jgi:ABC-2 type transport system permease protein
MIPALRIAGHELRGYLRAPAAWAIAALFLAVQGVGFAGQVAALSDPRRPAPLGAVLEGFFAGSLLTWSLGLAVIALLAMRALAEDRRAGTWETLLTAPVGEGAAVAGKWLAAAAFHAVLWVPTVAYLIVVAAYRPAGAAWDLAPVLTAYAGVVAIGAALLAVAFAASAFSPSPLVAGAAGYAALMLLLLAGELPALAPGLAADHPTLAAIVDAIAVRARLAELARGEVTLAAVALIAGLVAVGLSLAITGACAGRRRPRELRRRALATALVAAIAVQVGALAVRRPAAWDVTARRSNSLEPLTLDTLAALAAPVAVTIVRPTLAELDAVFAEAERVARLMAAAQPRLTVRVLDPGTASGGLAAIARATGLDALDLQRSGAVVLELAGRRRVIDLIDLASFAAVPGTKTAGVTRLSPEAELVARLRELADPRPLVACATTGHGELGLDRDPEVAELSALVDRIRADGGRVEPVETVAAGVPAACSVVVVAGPTAPVAPAEALALERWLDAGGGLLVMLAARPDGGALPPTGLEPVLARFGVAPADAVAVDPSLALDAGGAGGGGTIRVLAGYADHPVTAGFLKRRATVWVVPRVLELAAPAVPLVSTTAAGWGERRWAAPPVARDPDDLRGPVAIVAASERGDACDGEAGASVRSVPGGDSCPRRGRVVAIGSAESVSSAVIAGASAGELLAHQAIRWLAHRERVAVALPDKTPEQVRLVMTDGERRAVIALCAGGVPIGFAGLGAALAWRRRRRSRGAQA